MNKEKLKNLKLRLIALGLAGVIPMFASGCDVKVNNNDTSSVVSEIADNGSEDNLKEMLHALSDLDEEYGYLPAKLEDVDYLYSNGGLTYKYVLNLAAGDYSGLSEDKLQLVALRNFCEYKSDIITKDMQNDNNPYFNMYEGILRNVMQKYLIIPECYDYLASLYTVYGQNLSTAFKWDVKMYEFASAESENVSCIIIHTKVKSSDDWDYNLNRSADLELKKDYSKELKFGDSMESVVVLYRNEVIAFKQIGAGSECKNVQDALKGDISNIIFTVKELGITDKFEIVSRSKILNIQDEINEKDYTRIRK